MCITTVPGKHSAMQHASRLNSQPWLGLLGCLGEYIRETYVTDIGVHITSLLKATAVAAGFILPLDLVQASDQRNEDIASAVDSTVITDTLPLTLSGVHNIAGLS